MMSISLSEETIRLLVIVFFAGVALGALATLLEYNKEDVVNLKTLKEMLV